MRYQITGNGIVDLELNEVIAVRPGRFSDPQGHDDFPATSRRLVALLNAFDGWPVGQIEAFAVAVRSQFDLSKGMTIPPEVHVEFSDDHPQFLPCEAIADETARRLSAALGE